MPSSSPVALPSIRWGRSTRVTRESKLSSYGSTLRHVKRLASPTPSASPGSSLTTL